MNKSNRLIIALDTDTLSQAVQWAEALAPYCGMFKIGLELFYSVGATAVHEIACHRPVMLDLKLHDIPITVRRATRALAPMRPAMLTVHAAGGEKMVAAARSELPGHFLVAVTKLTSQGADPEGTLRAARNAINGGADGLVCSPWDANMLRFEFKNQIMLICPGIRPAGAEAEDHARPLTPRQAIGAGADWLVIGRPITGAPDPVAVARALAIEVTV